MPAAISHGEPEHRSALPNGSGLAAARPLAARALCTIAGRAVSFKPKFGSDGCLRQAREWTWCHSESSVRALLRHLVTRSAAAHPSMIGRGDP